LQSLMVTVVSLMTSLQALTVMIFE
jgi:hypothetical protein